MKNYKNKPLIIVGIIAQNVKKLLLILWLIAYSVEEGKRQNSNKKNLTAEDKASEKLPVDSGTKPPPADAPGKYYVVLLV